MKGFVKCIIAGAVILGIGIAVLIIALAVNGWRLAPNIEFETREFTSTEENTSLDVTLNTGKLKIEYYDGEYIQISYPVAKGFETAITENNGTLSIDGNTHKWYTFTWGVVFPETVVKIPEDKITEVDVTVNAGTVEIKEGTFEKVELSVNAGSCNIGNINCELLSIELNAGALSLDGVKAGKLLCNVRAGSATITKIDCAETEVEVRAGSANLTFLGTKSDYTATVNVSAGSCNGLSTQSGGAKKIDIDVSAGSCNVSFLG